MKILSFGSKAGTTLIEIMIALIIIALIILGGGMFFFYGRVNIIREAHRRAALLVASQRLEELKAADYSEINFGSDDKYHIVCKEGDWYIWSESEGKWYIWNESEGESSFVQRETPYADYQEPQEPVDVDNLFKDPDSGQTIVTEAQWKPAGGSDYLEITVTVNWHDSTTNSVSLTTLIAPR